jgi:ethanolamine permease
MAVCAFGWISSRLLRFAMATSFYILYTGAITELAARYKTSGGTFDFCSRSIGGGGAATLMAFFEVAKLLLSNSGYALCVASYLNQLGMSEKYEYLSWICIYVIFTLFDVVGIRQSKTLQILATTFCTVILLVYIFSCLSKFTVENLLSQQGAKIGLVGRDPVMFFGALPFALQFYLGFEEIPLLMTYAKDPERTIPRAVKLSCAVMVVVAMGILISGAGVSDSMDLMLSPAPLMVGFNKVYGSKSKAAFFFGISIVAALLNNFFAFAVYSSQQIQAVAQAGYLPQHLAYRSPVHQGPIASSIFVSIIGIAVTASFSLTFGRAEAQNVLVMASLAELRQWCSGMIPTACGEVLRFKPQCVHFCAGNSMQRYWLV